MKRPLLWILEAFAFALFVAMLFAWFIILGA